jgi:transcription antitermination factor NusG
MPILPQEPDLYPDGLFSASGAPSEHGLRWWVLHTRPRQEKSLARDLRALAIPSYLPQLQRRTPSRGRVLTSYAPLFPGYLFLLTEAEGRIAALATRRVARALEVTDQEAMWRDLRQVNQLLTSGAPVTPEDRLEPGAIVEIRTGPLAGLRGKILKSASGRRFVVAVDFIQRGASVLLDDFNLACVAPDETHALAH